MKTYESTPLVSVIIPHFDSSEWISSAISSIIEGNNKAVDEVVVVDDGSHPIHHAVLREIESLPKVRVIWKESNSGGAHTRNIAVENARNDWLFCLDADNLASPELVDSLLTHALLNDLDVACPEYCVFFNQSPQQPTHAWKYRSSAITFLDHFSSAYVPSASGNYLYKRSSFDAAGGYPAFSRALDTWSFGLRQVATGSQMRAVPGTFYLHRYGYKSYWVRESAKDGSLSLLATSLALPFATQIPKNLLKRLLGRRRNTWFDQLTKKPIWRTSDEPAGQLIQEPLEIPLFAKLEPVTQTLES